MGYRGMWKTTWREEDALRLRLGLPEELLRLGEASKGREGGLRNV